MNDKNLSLCRLAMYLSGDTLCPDDISKIVGIKPTEGRRNGEVWMTASNDQVVEKTGRWIWARSTKTDDVEGELSELLWMFPDGLLPATLPGVSDAFFDVFIANSPDEGGNGEGNITLSTQCLERLASFAIPLEITIAIAGD